MHFLNRTQGNFANGQCLLIENLITLYMGLIARAELMSPFIYPFILGCCSSVWKNSRNQCSDFGNYHNIYCASCERDWFIWSAGSLKEWSNQFPLPWCKFRNNAAKAALLPQYPALILQADWSSSLLQGTKELVAGSALEQQCPQTQSHSLFCWILLRNDDPEVATKISSVQWIFPVPLNMYFKVRS